jgi:hypothetical protein
LIACGALGGGALAVTSAVWFRSAHERGPSVAPQSRAAPPSTTRADEPRVTVPLWGADGMREVRDVASALESDWHGPTGRFTADPWLEQSHELEQRLAELLAEVESSGARLPAGETGKSRKE